MVILPTQQSEEYANMFENRVSSIRVFWYETETVTVISRKRDPLFREAIIASE
jgi:hypothetical protein